MENIFTKELIYIQEHLPSWKGLTSEEVIFEKLTGGVSREIYKVTAQRKEVEPNIIVFRKLNGNSEQNQIEAFAFETLSSLEVGPKLYAANSEYRIEQYLDCRMIKAKEINQKQFRRKLVMSLAAINKLNYKDGPETKGYFEKRFTDDFYKNFDRCCDLKDTYSEGETQFIKEIKYLSSPEEVEFIKSVISKGKLVFSHNDIWVGNLLVIDETSDPMLIDYELMGYNFIGYDIGKLILETVFHRPKSPDPYWEVRKEDMPSEEDILDFARYYLIASKCDSLSRQDKEELANNDEIIKQYEAKLFASKEEYNDTLENLLNQIRAGLMLSSYWCTTIGIIVGRHTYPNFDFVRFAQDNYQFYGKFKEHFLKGRAQKE